MQAGVFGAADPVLAPGPAAATQFQVSELPGPGVGGEAGDAVPAGAGEPQLGVQRRKVLGGIINEYYEAA